VTVERLAGGLPVQTPVVCIDEPAESGADAGERPVHVLLGTAVDGDLCTFGGKRARDGEPNPA